MGLQDGDEVKRLRRLGPPQPGAVQRFQNLAPVRALERVGHGQGRQRAGGRGECAEEPPDEVRREERPGRIVDQNVGRRLGREALQAKADRVLPRRPAGDRFEQVETLDRGVVAFPILGPDHGAHGPDAGVPAQGRRRVIEDRPPAQGQVLLGNLGAQAFAAPRRHDDCRVRHGAQFGILKAFD